MGNVSIDLPVRFQKILTDYYYKTLLDSWNTEL